MTTLPVYSNSAEPTREQLLPCLADGLDANFVYQLTPESLIFARFLATQMGGQLICGMANNNNSNNPICKVPECQKTCVALKTSEYTVKPRYLAPR